MLHVVQALRENIDGLAGVAKRHATHTLLWLAHSRFAFCSYHSFRRPGLIRLLSSWTCERTQAPCLAWNKGFFQIDLREGCMEGSQSHTLNRYLVSCTLPDSVISEQQSTMIWKNQIQSKMQLPDQEREHACRKELQSRNPY